MLRRLILLVTAAIAGLVLSPTTSSAESIDLAAINGLLAEEKRLFEAKDVDGLMALLTEDFVYVGPGVPPADKAQVRLMTYNSLITAKYAMLKTKILSHKIAEDGQSADVEAEGTTKYLVERGGRNHVISYHNIKRMQLVYRNGRVLFRRSETIKDLQ